MVVMPGTLHVAQLATSYFPTDEDLLVLLNGVSRWERNWVRQHTPFKKTVFSPLPLRHYEVIDVLLNSFNTAVGLVDSDLFVLDGVYCRKLREQISTKSLSACFSERNEDLGLDVPLTFFMFLNTGILRGISNRYAVGSAPRKWEELPTAVEQQLFKLRLRMGSYLQPYKSYFDTLHVMTLLALAEGYPPRVIECFPTVSSPSDKLFHVGAVSYWKRPTSAWEFRGAYFSQRVLERFAPPDMQAHYVRKFGNPSSSQILASAPHLAAAAGSDFIDFTEKLIERKRKP